MSAPAPPPVIAMRGIRKEYGQADSRVVALAGVDLVVLRGEYVAIIGPSGSGKSTLMNIIGCLDRPSAGTYALDGEEASALPDHRLANVRNRKIGFIFQNFNLLSRANALENVELPLRYRGLSARERRRLALQSLDRVGLANRVTHRPNELSGGQRQRVAIARALVTQPALLLADEPTGALDRRTGREIITLFDELHAAGSTIVVVTHDPEVAAYTRRRVSLVDGAVVEDGPVPRAEAAG
ncbi:MAG: ABC transporter ATP-binding protein [Deltaproteobacteria bacterium]|nr:ABC transporter ATP-binding protein [Deltaproteobacteria bacterium]